MKTLFRAGRHGWIFVKSFIKVNARPLRLGDTRMASWVVLYLLAGLLSPAPTFSFDVKLDSVWDAPAVVWTSRIGHSYRVCIDSDLMNIDTPFVTNLISTTGTNFWRYTNDAESAFFQVVDQDWRFRILNIDFTQDSNTVIKWSTRANGLYSLQRSFSLTGTFEDLTTTQPATPPLNTYTDSVMVGPDPIFYKAIEVYQAQTNHTDNVGGIQRIPINADGREMVSMAFDSFDGSLLSLDTVFGDPFPTGASCHAWNGVLQEYCSATNHATGWDPPILPFIERGLGFFFMCNQPESGTQHIIFAGSVPSTSTTSVAIYTNLSLISYGYPQTIGWLDTQLAQQAAYGDLLYTWNSTGQVYNTYYRNETQWMKQLGGDYEPATNFHIKPGHSFFYDSHSTNPQKSWLQVKPYTWP